MTKSAACCVAVALGLEACGSTYTMTDDIDLTWDFSLTPSKFDDDLHSPYVRGTKVTVFAHASDDDPDFRGWSIVSSDPAVFRINDSVVDGDGRGLAAHGQAIGEGTAALRLLDRDGDEVGHGVAEVLVPDRAELDAHGSLILGATTSPRWSRRAWSRAARRRTWCGTSAETASCMATGCWIYTRTLVLGNDKRRPRAAWQRGCWRWRRRRG